MEAAAAVVLVLYALPYILTALSAGWTAAHTVQEIGDEGGPIWEYLGLTSSYPLGLALLWSFAALQWGLAGAGYAGGRHWALWALLVIRLGDCVISHWTPWLRGRRPNPGLTTTPLYAIDAALAGMVLSGGLY